MPRGKAGGGGRRRDAPASASPTLNAAGIVGFKMGP